MATISPSRFSRGAELVKRKRTPPRTATGPYAYGYCRVLGGGVLADLENGDDFAVEVPDGEHLSTTA